MKSERAKQHIDNDTIEFRNGDRMVDASTAYIAVEIAEEDMIEKAVKAFAEACEMYAGNGRCLECVKCRDCEIVKQFRQRLEKR